MPVWREVCIPSFRSPFCHHCCEETFQQTAEDVDDACAQHSSCQSVCRLSSVRCMVCGMIVARGKSQCQLTSGGYDSRLRASPAGAKDARPASGPAGPLTRPSSRPCNAHVSWFCWVCLTPLNFFLLCCTFCFPTTLPAPSATADPMLGRTTLPTIAVIAPRFTTLWPRVFLLFLTSMTQTKVTLTSVLSRRELCK